MIATSVCLLTLALCLVGTSPTSRLRPALLHNLAWSIGAGVVASGLLGYVDVGVPAWALIVTSIVLVNVGIALAVGRSPSFSPMSRDDAGLVGLLPLWQFKVLVILYAVGVVGYLGTISDLFGISVLISDPAAIRSATEVSYLVELPLYAKLLYYLGPLCLVLGVYSQYVDGLHGKAWRIPLILLIAASQLLTLQRTNLFVALVWFAGLLVIGIYPNRQNRISGRTTNRASQGPTSTGRRAAVILMIGVVGVATFQGLAAALGKTGFENQAFSRSIDPRLRQNNLVSPMFYASSGLPAFSELTSSDIDRYPPDRAIVFGTYNPQTWGAATFSGPNRLLPYQRRWNEVAPFTAVPQSTNVYTWLEPWYRDFREFGVMGFSVVVGMLIGATVRRRKRNVEWQLLAGLLVGLTLLATFVNRYATVMSLVIYLAIGVLALANRNRVAQMEQRETVGSR